MEKWFWNGLGEGSWVGDGGCTACQRRYQGQYRLHTVGDTSWIVKMMRITATERRGPEDNTGRSESNKWSRDTTVYPDVIQDNGIYMYIYETKSSSWVTRIEASQTMRPPTSLLSAPLTASKLQNSRIKAQTDHREHVQKEQANADRKMYCKQIARARDATSFRNPLSSTTSEMTGGAKPVQSTRQPKAHLQRDKRHVRAGQSGRGNPPTATRYQRQQPCLGSAVSSCKIEAARRRA